MNNTAKLQEALYNAGMYKGMKDKDGNELSFEKAVDGIPGNQTEAAIAKAQKMGYDIDINKGIINKSAKSSVRKNSTQSKLNSTKQEASFFPNIFNFFGGNEYVPSSAHNMQAVMEHKVNTGVTEPYFYINPKEGKLYRLQGDQVLYETPIATGVNFGSDGFVELPMKNGKLDYDRSLTTSSTPAGIFTLSRMYKGYNNEPSFHLIEAERGNPDAKMLQVAMHAPASVERQNRMMKGEKRLTYGCIQLPNGEIKCEFNKGNINKGDSVYIEPTVEGNYFYEDKDGLMKTHFKETPKHVTGDIWGKHFDLNNVRYNTGY